MATYGQTVTITQIDQVTSRSSVGTTTGTLVVPTNAEAEVFVACFAQGASLSVTTSIFTSPNFGTIVGASDNSGTTQNEKRNLVLGPGTYTLSVNISLALSGTPGSVRIVGSLRQF